MPVALDIPSGEGGTYQVEATVTDAQGRRNQSQQIVGVDLRADNLHRHDRIVLDTPQQTSKQRGLACAHIAGDDDESLALMQTIFKIGQCALMASAAEEKIGVWVELKGLGAQTEMTLVHGWPAGLMGDGQKRKST